MKSSLAALHSVFLLRLNIKFYIYKILLIVFSSNYTSEKENIREKEIITFAK